ncbi:MAG: hypothetical protein K0S53_3092 [Bacteroidetes bacterium]|nr:hypothetical protein [Bacteroidota bacterium]MDF2453084.1 hypothetical protein [Bacteroidota bacterium]
MLSKTIIFKKALLIITLLVLFLPLFQSSFNFVKLYKLAGDDVVCTDTSFTKSTYFSGIWQQKMSGHLSHHFGFRSLLIKINNQILFSLFNRVNANGVVAGKDGYLFETTYIRSFCGDDFMGEDSINLNLDRLKLISEQFGQLNKQLIVVIAPGKPAFYKEYLPRDVKCKGSQTNYAYIAEAIKTRNINCIDFSKWFMEHKADSKYPLYPKHGNHWSTYGSWLAADSIIKYIEFKKNCYLPNLSIKSIHMDQPKNEDKDIEYGINLLFKLKSFDLAYPEIEVTDTIGKIKPKLLVIGDSFYWNLYRSDFVNCFDQPTFLYYNKVPYPEGKEKVLDHDHVINKQLDRSEVIMILATESNIKSMGWGFLEDAENYLKKWLINHPIIDQPDFTHK